MNNMNWKNTLKKIDEQSFAREQYPKMMKLFLKETDAEEKEMLHNYMRLLERKMGVPESTMEQRELNRGGSMQ